MKALFLANKLVWEKILALAKRARRRRFIATPYLTGSVSRALRLKRGDVLICDLTIASCRNGSIDPREIKRLKAKGVRVYTHENLHAKVYLMGDHAVVGSANLTLNSQLALDEAAVLVTQPKSLREIRLWFEARTGAPIQPEWLQTCISAYRSPRGASGATSAGGRQPVRRSARGVLIASLVPREDTEKEERVVARAEKLARRRLKRPRLSSLENIRWDGSREFLRGDVVIQVVRDGDDTWVYPHATVIDVRVSVGPAGGRRTYVFLEAPRSYRRVRFEVFAKRCREIGLRLSARRTKRVTDPGLVQQLKHLTSAEKQQRR